MSQKAQTGSFPEGQPAGQAEPSFASLPEPVVAHIAHVSKIKPGWPGHPLLQVSRSGRDAVLSSCTKVTLNTPPVTQQASKACARLLHRACCQAPPGLCLDLLLMKHSDSPPYLLPQLLQPGLSSGGWRNVHELQVCTIVQHTNLFALAFPALTKLRLNRVDLEDGELFSMLAAQASCSMTSISLSWCNIKDTAVEGAAAALARLPSLNAFHVSRGTVPLRIASQLTALTSLEGALEAGVPPPDTQLVRAVSRNRGLQSLTVSRNTSVLLSAPGMLQHLLSSCTNLTHIDLTNQLIDDYGLGVLLRYASNVTDVELGYFELAKSRANSRCRWQRLKLETTPSLVEGLAYLPLKSVQDLVTGWEVPGTLRLPLTPSSQLHHLLYQAAYNLAACPAWQRKPAARILLFTHPYYHTATIPDAQVAQLVWALSLIGGPHLQHLGMNMNAKLGQQEVQVLARSLGSGLTSLSLRRGRIKPSFWSALSQHLSHLKELGLMRNVEVNVMGIIAYLRTLPQPFTLHIGPGVWADHTLADLTDGMSAWQLQTVSFQQEYEEDAQEFLLVDLDEMHWQQEQQKACSEGDEEADVVDTG